MSKWKQAKVADIPGVATASDALGTAASATASALDTAAGVFATLAEIVALFPASTDLTSALKTALSELANLRDSGVYAFTDATPFLHGASPDGVSGFLTRLDASFDDAGDDQRPQFSGAVDVGAIVFLVGAPHLPDFQALLQAIVSLIDFPISLPTTTIPSADTTSYPDRCEAALSAPPDWRHTARLGDVMPVFDELMEVLQKAFDMMAPIGSFGEQLAALAEVIHIKATQLRTLSATIAQVLDSIAAIQSTNIYALRAASTSLDSLRSAISSADTSDIGLPPDAYVLGICLLGGGTDATALTAAIDALISLQPLSDT